MTTWSRGVLPGARSSALMGGLGAVALVLTLVSGIVPNLPWLPQWSRPESTVRQLTDVGGEMSLWVWFNAMTLAAAGGVHVSLAWLRRRRGLLAWPFAVFGVTLAGLSVDDFVALHERLEPLGLRMGAGEGWLTAAWVFPGLIFAVFVLLSGLRVALAQPRTPRFLLVLGVGLFLGAAFGIELVSFAWLDGVGRTPVYVAMVHLEELLEAWGAVLLLTSVVTSLDLRVRADEISISMASPTPGRELPADAVRSASPG